MMRRAPLIAATASLLWSGLALAQYADPTRPPGASAADPVSGAGDGGVQAVIVRRGSKTTAVINGQPVKVGGSLDGKRVLRIGESEIVLQGDGGREVLKVMPAVDKVPAKKTAAARQRTTGTERP